jgi:very-short-patch-repair endonuclease
MLPFNKKLKPFARDLRSNMTDAEQLIWSKIRRKQIGDLQFYRQKNIGDFIVDFYCPKGKLIVEIDGGQHYKDDGRKKDQTRDNYLQKLGFAVLRFSDIDVLKNIDGVVERIYEHLKSPQPPFKKGEGKRLDIFGESR